MSEMEAVGPLSAQRQEVYEQNTRDFTRTIQKIR